MSVSVTDHKIRLRATVSVLPLRWKMIQPEQLGPEHIDNHFTAVFTLLLLLLFNSKIIILNEKKKCDSHITGRPSIWPELYITSCLHCRLVAITVWGRSGINWLVSFTKPGPCFGEHLYTLGASHVRALVPVTTLSSTVSSWALWSCHCCTGLCIWRWQVWNQQLCLDRPTDGFAKVRPK